MKLTRNVCNSVEQSQLDQYLLIDLAKRLHFLALNPREFDRDPLSCALFCIPYGNESIFCASAVWFFSVCRIFSPFVILLNFFLFVKKISKYKS
jgi:hypothetical protein